MRTSLSPAPDTAGFDVETVLTARAPLRVVSLRHACSFPPGAGRARGTPLDFAWSPNLQPGPRDVAGEHVFRSPCLVARHAGAQLALVPHLDPALFTGPLRHALSFRDAGDADAPGVPLLELARLDHEPRSHVFYRATGRAAALAPGDELRLAFTLLADGAADASGLAPVVRFTWRRWGERAMAGADITPQALSFDAYAREAFASVFDRYGLWREFAVGGRRVGGTCIRIVRPSLDAGSAPLPRDRTLGIALHYLLTPTMAVRDKVRLLRENAKGIHPHAWHNLFLNNLRTAFGVGWYARRWGDARLAGYALLMRELALAAPAPHGLPPAACTADPVHPRWPAGTRGAWFLTRAHCSPDAAWTGTWMLHHHRHLDPDPRLLDRCRALGDALLRAQLPSGAIPAWVRVRGDGRTVPVPPLVESASSAGPGTFLAMLHEATGEPRYLDAARRAADFVVERVAPRQAWHDAELFFSCSKKRPGWRDPRSGIPPQSTFPIAWSADLLRRVFLATGRDRYRDAGRAALDLLLLFQQAWDPPFIGFAARGGFGVMNTDAEWSDARQAQFATLLMEWYDVTGEAELFHRGVAALRASFALMYLEEHRRLAPGNVRAMQPVDRGAVAENYGHAGRDAKIQGYLMPDWGGGSAASSTALARARWGDLYLDARRGAAFGIDGCRVTRGSIAGGRADLDLDALPGPGGAARRLTVKATGVGGPGLALRVNGRDRGVHDRAEIERGIEMEAP